MGFAVTIASTDCLYEEFATTIQDLTACHKLHFNANLTESIKDTVCDTICGDTKIYLVVPEEHTKALQSTLPTMEKRKLKLEAEIEKLQEVAATDVYHKRTAEFREQHSKKVSFYLFITQ